MAETKRIFIDVVLASPRGITTTDAEKILSEVNRSLAQNTPAILDFCGISSMTTGFLVLLLQGIENKSVIIDESSLTDFQKRKIDIQKDTLAHPKNAEWLKRIEEITLYG